MSWLGRTLRAMHIALGAFSRQRAPSTAVTTLPGSIPLASAEDGARVRVRARVIPPEVPLRAPLTGRPCAFWSITIEELVKERNGSPQWVSRTRDASVQAFEVEDETGRASIDVRGMQAWARADATRDEPTPVVLDPALQVLLARYGSDLAPLRQRGGKLRVREGVFQTGEELFLQGRARWFDEVAIDAASYRDAARTQRLVIGPDEDEPVYASDDPEGPY